MLNKNLDKKSALRFSKILEFADFITVPTIELRNSLPNKFEHKIYVIDDSIDELCLPVGLNENTSSGMKVLWYGHAGWAKIRPGPSESLKLFIDYMSHPLFDQVHEGGGEVEFYIVSNAVDRVREYISEVTENKKIFVSTWSIDIVKRRLSECDLVLIPYGTTNDLDLTKSSNRLELALLSGRGVLTNRFFPHWDSTLKNYVFKLDKDTNLFDIKKYMGSVQGNYNDAQKYLLKRQADIYAGWAQLIN